MQRCLYTNIITYSYSFHIIRVKTIKARMGKSPP
nr:MAG TPA: hypothetical protein [Caudoviricetes sp.]DAI05315.1 MAG TPA: hypothetical protein [Crassvirales sp.]DAO10562.1 MAG TPA: hypothetical protein [Bacteriophage sp.]